MINGSWIGSGTPFDEPYPCSCLNELHFQDRPAHPSRCSCVGRIDIDNVTAGCCAARLTLSIPELTAKSRAESTPNKIGSAR